MESINKVEIKGVVGSVRVFDESEGKVARFSVATNECFKNRDGAEWVETTWHNVTAWNKPGVENIETINKGDTVHLFGHLRAHTYVDPNGCDRAITEVVADRLEIHVNDL